MDLIKRLEIYRLENRISQEDLAEALGKIAFSTVNRWLNGKAKPNKIKSYHIEKLINSKWIPIKKKKMKNKKVDKSKLRK